MRDDGIDPEHATVEQLAAVDHFHSFGIAGTLELANRAGITSGERVLDVGVVSADPRACSPVATAALSQSWT